MKKRLTFRISIGARPGLVWETMLAKDTYPRWTAPFGEGTSYDGSWEKGSRILFLAPNGDGMVAEIADSRSPEYVSIRHLGAIKNGVEDTTSEEVRAWAPAYENYELSESQSGTDLTVELDTMAEYEQYMLEIFPKALDLLKEICEAGR